MTDTSIQVFRPKTLTTVATLLALTCMAWVQSANAQTYYPSNPYPVQGGTQYVPATQTYVQPGYSQPTSGYGYTGQVQTGYGYQYQPAIGTGQSYQRTQVYQGYGGTQLGGIPASNGNTYRNQVYSQPQGTSRSATTSPAQATSAPTYVAPIAVGGVSKNHRGTDYSANAGIGLDQRTETFVGGRYNTGEKFIGAGASVGAGLYGDAQASQSGRIGKVDVRNYAEGSTFVGSEVGAQAGIGREGVKLGANGFTGGRVSGTIGSDVGPIGYGVTGEAWSGAGVEAGVNAGFKDGVLTYGGELGAGLGVGGKLGVQGSLDVGAVGDGIRKTAVKAGDWGKRAGSEVKDWSKQRVSNVKRDVSRHTNNVKKGFKKAGGKIKKFFKK